MAEDNEKENENENNNEEKDTENDSEQSTEKKPLSIKKVIIIMTIVFTLILAATVSTLVILLGDSGTSQSADENAASTEMMNEEQSANTPAATEETVKEESTENLEEPKEMPQEPAAQTVKGPAMFYTIRPAFVVNFQKAKRAKYLQASVSIMTRDDDVIDDIIDTLPLIKNDLITLFSSQNEKKLSSPDGKEALRKEALEIIQDILQRETGRVGAEDVLFTSFVIQH